MEQFERMAWMSELVCHGRPYLIHLKVGEEMAKILQGDKVFKAADIFNPRKTTYYSLQQATRFCAEYGQGVKPMDWATFINNKNALPEELESDPACSAMLQIIKNKSQI